MSDPAALDAPTAGVPVGAVRSTAIVALGTALSRATGFVRIAAIAYALGAGTLAGVYSYANETPNIVYELLLGGVLTATLVPLFVRAFHTGDDDAVSSVITVSLVGLIVVTVAGVVAAPWIVRGYTVLVHGSTVDEQRDLATQLLRLLMPQIFFYGVTALATAALNARRRFTAAAFAPILNNVVVTGVFIVFAHAVTARSVGAVLDDGGLLLLLGLGTTAGVAAMAAPLVPALVRPRHHRAHGRTRFLTAWRHPAVRTMVRLSGWTAGYVVANQITLFVVTVLANDTPGGPFVYIAAYAFFQLPHGLFTVSLMTTFTPELAAAAARNDLVELRAKLSQGLRLTITAIVPSACLYLVLAHPLVVALLERGAFTRADSDLVADTLAAFAVGLLPFSLYLFSLRVFYAGNDTFTPFWLNGIENLANIAFAVVLYAWLGIPGLALAFASAYVVAALITFVVIHRRLGGIGGRRILATGARCLVVGAVAAAVAELLSRVVGTGSGAESLLAVGVAGAGGLAAYAGTLAVLRAEELDTLRNAFGARRRARAASA